MAQNLPAPCYQVYAASTLASLPFRQAALAVRGLIHTMQLECWVNYRMPNNPAALARVLGLDVREVAAALPEAMAYFQIEGEYIICPQLEDYRNHLNEIREKQKAGGKKGADITNGGRKRSGSVADIGLRVVSPNPQVNPRVSSKAQHNTEKQSQNQPSGEDSSMEDEWLIELENASRNQPW